MVAGMCVMQDGIIKKNLARRFRIKTVFEQDDPRCMKEVIARRLKYSIDNEKSGFGKMPDVIFVDGGITQIRAAREAVEQYYLKIPIFGMVKNDKHQTRALMNEERQELALSEEAMKHITLFQDNVHDTAIGYHKKLREASVTKSALDEVEGIGPAKKKLLLQTFGSVEKIKNASREELTKLKGINEALAQKLKEEL